MLKVFWLCIHSKRSKREERGRRFCLRENQAQNCCLQNWHQFNLQRFDDTSRSYNDFVAIVLNSVMIIRKEKR